MLYRILGLDDWNRTLEDGTAPRCGADERDGFVHLSTAETYLETANLYFEASEEPVVLEINPALLGDALKWETVASRNHQEFPHLYAPGIPLHAVRKVVQLHEGNAGFEAGEILYSQPAAP